MKKKPLLLIFVFILVVTNFAFAQGQNTNRPVVTFDGKSGGKITKADLLNVDSLTVTGGDYSIFSFTFSAAIEGRLQESNNNSGEFNANTKKIISLVKSGSKVFIENIKVLHLKSGKRIAIPAIIFTIE